MDTGSPEAKFGVALATAPALLERIEAFRALEPMLYGQRFAPAIVDRDRPVEACEPVGRHCESGDVLVPGARLATPEVGDLLVMPVTGAYCYSLQNNYNGARRPPVVLCGDGEARLAVRRETMDDLLARDVA
jgi:diaminopimelate decarboxylase